MRVLIDSLGATEHSGGMRLHATEIVRAWAETFPEDELHVLAGEWALRDFANLSLTVHSWPNEGVIGRSFGQVVQAAIISRRVDADAVISLSPIVAPFSRRVPKYCFQHDWRHMRNPHEFPLHQRAYRHLWRISAVNATSNLCISTKAERETQEYAPGSRTTVIPNGRDHARRWNLAEIKSRDSIVTFGHHNNKRPELVIDALAMSSDPLLGRMKLVVLGARGAYATELQNRASELGVIDRVSFPGFVSPDSYEEIVSTAAILTMASSDEGFGLPIAEAQFFGIPAVVTSDSGMTEIFGDYPIVAEPTAESLGEALASAAGRGRRAETGLWSWADTVAGLRSSVADDLADVLQG